MMPIVAHISMVRAVTRMSVEGGVTIERNTVGALVDGRYEGGDTSSFVITAAVQPLGETREMLPEGERTKEGWKVFSTSALRPVQRSTGIRGDIVVWQGRRYEVVDLEDFDVNGKYWRALIVKVDQ